ASSWRSIHACTSCCAATTAPGRTRATGHEKGAVRPLVAGTAACATSGGRGLGLRPVALAGRLDVERHLAVLVDIDRQASAIDQPAEQQFVGKRAADGVLDEALHRPRTHERIEAF